LWRQKYRVQWLKEGEKNNKLFHRTMMHKMYDNCITKLEYDQGQPIMDHEGIKIELVKYYKNLLLEPLHDRTPSINKLNCHIPTIITP
jgi:hypothetical protein